MFNVVLVWALVQSNVYNIVNDWYSIGVSQQAAGPFASELVPVLAHGCEHVQ